MPKGRSFETRSDVGDVSDSDDEEPLTNPFHGKGHPSSSDEEEEVYGLVSSEDESDDGNDEHAGAVTEDIKSDIEDEERDGLPDSRAWGHKRKSFYNADYVDPDLFSKDPEAAKLEETEAREIQERLAEQLDAGASFSLEMLVSQTCSSTEEKTVKPQEAPVVEERILTDLSTLSKRQKLDLMRKESPEFFGLVKDFKESMTEMVEKWQPMMKLVMEGKVKSPAVEQLVRTEYELMLNYCTHIGFYLLLKCKKLPVRSHPVVKRLCQLKELLKSLSDVSNNIGLQEDELMKAATEGPEMTVLYPESEGKDVRIHRSHGIAKRLGILGKRVVSDEESDEEREEAPLPVLRVEPLKSTKGAGGYGGKRQKQVAFEDEEVVDGEFSAEGDSGSGPLLGGEQEEEEEKRAITYQMAKNKGLTPRRKKEQRNPRVKHRNRFKKAKTRRKGQVREVYSETRRYGGEISGIKASVSKSIKIK